MVVILCLTSRHKTDKLDDIGIVRLAIRYQFEKNNNKKQEFYIYTGIAFVWETYFHMHAFFYRKSC